MTALTVRSLCVNLRLSTRDKHSFRFRSKRQGQSWRRKGPHFTVPTVGEPGPKEENVDVEGIDPAPTVSALTAHAGSGPVVPPAHCSCTFITFSDDATFEEWFPQGRPPKVPVREVCSLTHRSAVYTDPGTDIPYATARAFKIIREAYKKYITAHGLPPAASALSPGPPPPELLPDSGPRASHQKIVIKQILAP
ncbi:putative vacuolar protein sorting-associated protein 72 like protein [Cricetulus griseus]|uniref:Putative vacuolar protein sorting-associated protein 72 like protein n=1 Tax=Cricetulus griseus TaxID=10029 RepID=A0A061I1K5_CRIGR|nr:putative vacuolar protein sorting-associated protein 72 like protein [Cricetulus griseus]